MSGYIKPEQIPLLITTPPWALVLRGGDLRAGDQILGCRTGMGIEWTWWRGQILTEAPRAPRASKTREVIDIVLLHPNGLLAAYPYPRFNQYLVIRPDIEDNSMWPHKCPRCGNPAYIGGMNNVDCKAKCQ